MRKLTSLLVAGPRASDPAATLRRRVEDLPANAQLYVVDAEAASGLNVASTPAQWAAMTMRIGALVDAREPQAAPVVLVVPDAAAIFLDSDHDRALAVAHELVRIAVSGPARGVYVYQAMVVPDLVARRADWSATRLPAGYGTRIALTAPGGIGTLIDPHHPKPVTYDERNIHNV